jgi:hypothetical protein
MRKREMTSRIHEGLSNTESVEEVAKAEIRANCNERQVKQGVAPKGFHDNHPEEEDS